MDAINNPNHIHHNQSKTSITSMNGSVGACYAKTSSNGPKMSTEDQFKAAVNVIKQLPKNGPFQPSDDLKLRFYALYKQATDGPNTTKKPAFYDIVNRYKWDAWKRLGDMSAQTAMDSYVDELKKVIETMSFNESVSEFYEVLGPFHEFLPPETNGSDDSNNSNDANELQVENESDRLVHKMIKVGKKIPKNPYKDMFQTNGDDLGIDSEGEEFSDTYDHIGENGEIPVVERNGSDFSIKDMVSVRGGNDSNPSAHISPSNSTNPRNEASVRNNNTRELGMPSGQDLRPHNSRGDGGPGGHGSNPRDYSIGINEQLALAVIRLQQSMDQVVNRLDALESMLSRETRNKSSPKNKSSVWPFEELRPQTALVLLVWPLVVQWIVQYIQFKRRNK